MLLLGEIICYDGPIEWAITDKESVMNPVKNACVLFSLMLLILSGCSGIGPGTVSSDRFEYTDAISES